MTLRLQVCCLYFMQAIKILVPCDKFKVFLNHKNNY